MGTTARVGSDYNLNRVALTPEEVFTNELYGDNIGIVFAKKGEIDKLIAHLHNIFTNL